VRLKDPGPQAYNTAFTMNLIRGLLTALIVLVAAYPASVFFKEPRLQIILLILGGAMMLGSFENIGIVEYRRDLRFHIEFQLQSIPRVAGITAAIGYALYSPTYWALVVGIVSTRGLRFVLTYVFSSYRPRLELGAWRGIGQFSVWSWWISLVEMLNDRLPTIFIGRLLDARHVGFFNLGLEIALLPTTELIHPLSRTCFSTFAAARHARSGAADAFLRIMSMAVLITAPAGIGILVLARPVVTLAFGGQWDDATPVVQLMALAGVATSFGVIAATLLSAYGSLHILLSISVITTVLRTAGLFVLTGSGLSATALVVLISGLFEQFAYFAVSVYRFRISLMRLTMMIWRSFAATVVMALGVMWFGQEWSVFAGNSAVSLLQLFASAGFGAVLYTGLVLTLWVASGCPAGPETDFLALVQRTCGKAASLVWARGR
jgi:O-antigen/teichoic acid export membrane protein